MTPDIVQYRPPQARIAVAYSSKDRVEQTRLTIARLVDDPRLDLYWFDGSATEAGRDLPLELCAGRRAVCAVHRGVVGGPDSAIMYALETLRPHAYDLVILIENDVVLQDGWFEAMQAAISRAEGAGFKVGAATVRVLAKRVLSFNDDYCLMLNSGAGFIALTPAAVDIVLAHYRTLDGAEFIRHFRAATGIDVTGTVEFQPSQRLSVDWLFDLILYLHGYVSAAPPVTFAATIDDGRYPDFVRVAAVGQHLPQVHSRLTRPEQIRQAAFPFFQFQKSPLSDRLLVGCHQLLVGVNSPDGTLPVRASGAWRRTWLQGLGPFGLLGSGEISVADHGGTTGLFLYSGKVRSEVRLSRLGGPPAAGFVLEPNTLVDIPMAGGAGSDLILHVQSGEVCMIGLTTNADTLSHYANNKPAVDHLPL